MESDKQYVEIKAADVTPEGRHPEDILSNLCNNAFLTYLRDSKKEGYKKYIYPRLWPNWLGVEEDYV